MIDHRRVRQIRESREAQDSQRAADREAWLFAGCVVLLIGICGGLGGIVFGIVGLASGVPEDVEAGSFCLVFGVLCLGSIFVPKSKKGP